MTSEKKEMITFSILVPVYQVEDYVEECIQSVLKQTYQNWELILVDDGSRDRSGEICDRYAEQYENIHVYHKENRGQLHTRIYALERAKGMYCVFLDSDDMLKEHALEMLRQTIEKYDCDCVIYGYERVLDGQVVERTTEDACCITDKRDLYRKVFLRAFEYSSLCRKAVRKSIFQNIDYDAYYHIVVSEDLLQSLEVFKESRKVAFIEDRLYLYRLRHGSITESLGKDDYSGYVPVLEEVLRFLQEQELFTEEDFIQYRSSCMIFICSYIYAVSLFSVPMEDRIRIFSQLKQSAYYRDFLKAGPYDKTMLDYRHKVILTLFFKEKYRMLIGGISAYKFLRTRYRKLKVDIRNRK